MKRRRQTSTPPAAAVIVGARQFMFSEAARNSPRIAWWQAAPDGEPELLPRGLKTIFTRANLARRAKLESLAKAQGAELVEFTDEREIFPALAKLLKLEPDRARAAAAIATQEVEEPELSPPTADLRLKSAHVIDIPVGRIRAFKGQPRTWFHPERLRALARSIRRGGQQVPVIVVPVAKDPQHDYQLYDGERRWRACQIIKKATIRAIVAESAGEAEMFKGSAICNFGREDHTDLEVAQALKRVKETEEITIQELADLFGRSVSWVMQHLTLLRLAPGVVKRLAAELPEAEQITYSVALEISKLPVEHQEPAAEHIVKRRLGLNAARLYVRKLTAQHGTSSGSSRKRKPSDQARSLRWFIRRTPDDAERFLHPPEFPLSRVTALMPREERREASKQIGRSIEMLREIQKTMEVLGK